MIGPISKDPSPAKHGVCAQRPQQSQTVGCCRSKYQKGKGSLKSSAWEILKHHPQGLDIDELASKIRDMGEYESKDQSGVRPFPPRFNVLEVQRVVEIIMKTFALKYRDKAYALEKKQ